MHVLLELNMPALNLLKMLSSSWVNRIYGLCVETLKEDNKEKVTASHSLKRWMFDSQHIDRSILSFHSEIVATKFLFFLTICT